MAREKNQHLGEKIVTAAKSRERMLPDVPVVKGMLRRHHAEDLAEMIFGDDKELA